VVFYDRFYGYGSPDNGDGAIRGFFDSLVSDDRFRRDRIGFGRRLVEAQFDSRRVFAPFRETLARVADGELPEGGRYPAAAVGPVPA
jgi:hypothetical protein